MAKSTGKTHLIADFEKFLRKLLKENFDTSEIQLERSGEYFSLAWTKFSMQYNNSEWIIPFYTKKLGEEEDNKRLIYWIGV